MAIDIYTHNIGHNHFHYLEGPINHITFEQYVQYLANTI
jgi:hypothetical protein